VKQIEDIMASAATAKRKATALAQPEVNRRRNKCVRPPKQKERCASDCDDSSNLGDVDDEPIEEVERCNEMSLEQQIQLITAERDESKKQLDALQQERIEKRQISALQKNIDRVGKLVLATYCRNELFLTHKLINQATFEDSDILNQSCACLGLTTENAKATYSKSIKAEVRTALSHHRNNIIRNIHLAWKRK
jgi:hypothetical protein